MSLFLFIGLLMGMRHALEVDHLAAILSLSTRSAGRVSAMLRGAAWGVGHTSALIAAGGICLALGATISDIQARWLERGVGVMLVLLGVNVLIRFRRRRIHVHIHRHEDGVVHVHAHRHTPGEHHDPSHHAHVHAGRSHFRAALVGTMHGLAGSAALLLLTASSTASLWRGLAYIALFGLGSILGMALLSVAISIPLEFSARRLTRAFAAIEIVVALGTVALGTWMMR